MNVKALRKRLGLTQAEFWTPLGVTQSGGSRYESGRPMLKPVRLLVAIVYGPKREQAAALRRLGVLS